MTFRAKPVVKRAHRPSWESQDRRNFYLNLGFGLVVVAAVAHPPVAAGLTWYNDHLASVGSVNGQSITKDEFATASPSRAGGCDEAERRIRTADARRAPDRRRRPQAQHADRRPSSAAARRDRARADHRHEAPGEPGGRGGRHRHRRRHRRPAGRPRRRTPESRHAWVIEVAPADRRRRRPSRPPPRRPPPRPRPTRPSRTCRAARPGTTSPRPSRPTARPRRRPATSAGSQTDDSQARRGVRHGAVRRAEPTRRPRSSRAPTASSGSAGSPRSRQRRVDADYQAKLENDGIDLAKYRAVVGRRRHPPEARGQDRRRRHRSPGRSASVSEIYIARATDASSPADAIKARHILYAPKDDPSAAPAATIPGGRSGVGSRARPRPRRPTSKLLADPSHVRRDRPGRERRGLGTGRDRDRRQAAVLRSTTASSTRRSRRPSSPGLKPGDILAPIKSAFGWHVIQIMYRPTDDDLAQGASRPRPTAGPTSPPSPATTPRRRRPAAAATSAGSPRASSTTRLIDAHLRDAGRQDRRRRRPSPDDGVYLFKVLERGDPDAGGPPARGRSRPRPSRTGTRPRRSAATHHPRRRPSRGAAELGGSDRCSTRSSPRRGCAGGSIPAAGLQVVAAERLIGTPDRGVAAGPARAARACLRAARPGPDADRPASAAARPRTDPAATRPARRPRPALSRPSTRSGGSGPRRRDDGRRADAGRSRGAAVPRARSHPSWPPPARGRCPGSAPGCAQPDGCPWDREQTHESLRKPPARGGLRGLRRARGRRDAGAGRGARRPAAPGRPARAARGRGGRLRPGRRPGRARRRRSSAATRTSSATPRRGPRRT